MCCWIAGFGGHARNYGAGNHIAKLIRRLKGKRWKGILNNKLHTLLLAFTRVKLTSLQHASLSPNYPLPLHPSPRGSLSKTPDCKNDLPVPQPHLGRKYPLPLQRLSASNCYREPTCQNPHCAPVFLLSPRNVESCTRLPRRQLHSRHY